MNATACHIADDLLESYAMGKLSERETAPLEEHLLLCAGCQERLAGLDDFIQVVKAALAVPPPPDSLVLRIPIQQKKRHVLHCCS
jgi:anti-sigma factor RsiW